MRVRILGSAAGGGFPQWNCNCPICQAARGPSGRAAPRTQSSIAVRGARGPWFLVNASPDLRQQLEALPTDRTDGLRASPVAGVLLTDAEIDHTAGLLLLRESSAPLQVYSTEEVRRALTDHYPVLRMLESYCGVDWRRIEPGTPVTLAGSLEVEAFPTGGDPPLYMRDAAEPMSVGLTIRDLDSGRAIAYAPAVASIDEDLAHRFGASDCVLVDGTFWSEDELRVLGFGSRGAQAMGHAPLEGPGGSLAILSTLGARTILVHVNNTNPILLDDSTERATVEAGGIEVGVDGMEIEL